MSRRRNLLAVLILVILVAAAAAAGLLLRPSAPGAPTGEPLYLLVTAGNTTWAPIPLEEENTLTLAQGEDRVNVIHLTPVSVWMESSTCENQDCVEQGVVSAENRSARALGNAIICLPHRVLVELFTAPELEAMGLMPKE